MLAYAVQLAFIAWLCLGAAPLAGVRAQTAELSSTLTIKRGSPGCVEVDALRKRIAQYLAVGVRAPELTIAVDLERLGFRVLRDGRVVAERRFDRPPRKCAERRDALAFAIALAIEQAESVPTPPPASDGVESSKVTPKELPPRTDSSARGSSGPARGDSGSPAPRETPAGGAAGTTPGDSGSPASRSTPAGGAAGAAPSPVVPEPIRRDPDTHTADRTPDLSPPIAAEAPADDLDEFEAPDAGPSRPEQRWGVYAGASYQSAVLHTPSFLFNLGGEFAPLAALRVGLSALVAAPVTTAFDTGRVHSQLFGGEAFACLNAPVLGLLAVGCAGATAALVRAQGDAYTRDYSDQMSWISAFVRAALEFPARGSWAGRVFADVRANLLRPELHVARMPQPDLTLPLEPWGAGVGAQIILRLD